MTDGLLLDSHVLVWFDQNLALSEESGFAISDASIGNTLYVSDISIWELGVATYKKNLERRPNLRGQSIEAWFEQICERLKTRPSPISKAIAQEAANVPGLYGSGDPGDCFLIATAHLQNLTLITRDTKILDLAHLRPDYLTTIAC